MSRSGDTGVAVVASAALVGGAALANDPVLPFYSVTFSVGTAVTYYLAISAGPLAAGLMGASVLTAQALHAITVGGEAMDVATWQVPTMGLFYLGLSVLPGLLPAILEREEVAIQRDLKVHEEKLEELMNLIGAERKGRVDDRTDEDRLAMVRITSRMTQLTAFLREVLQAASTKEILQLFFTNVTKAFGAKEVALLTILPEDGVAVINKAAHPEYGRLEGKRIDLSSPAAELLARAAEKGVPLLLPERVVYFEPDLGARLILPIRVGETCEALVTVGVTRQEEELSAEDATFLGGLAELAGYGVEQLQVVLSS